MTDLLQRGDFTHMTREEIVERVMDWWTGVWFADPVTLHQPQRFDFCWGTEDGDRIDYAYSAPTFILFARVPLLEDAWVWFVGYGNEPPSPARVRQGEGGEMVTAVLAEIESLYADWARNHVQ